MCILFIWFLLCVGAYASEANGATKGCTHISEAIHFYEQKLDHFYPTDERTWSQRFQISNNSYEVGGPVLLYLNGESAIKDLKSYTSTQWMLWAKELKALVVIIDHRYYKHQLMANVSINNLKYLTADQALADFARLVPEIVEMCSLPVNTKWVAVGGSYGGTLAAWMRYKYPHLIHTAVSSSSPIKFKLTLEEYEETAFQDIEKIVKGCGNKLLKGIAGVLRLLEKNQTQAEKTFRLCKSSLSDFKTMEMFRYQMNYDVVGAAQYHGTVGIQNLCSYFDKSSSPTQGFINFITRSYDRSLIEGKRCILFSFKSRYDRRRLFSEEYMWLYQKCSEFGLFKTSKIFKLDVSYYFSICSELFDKALEKPALIRNINMLNTLKGAKHIKASRVIYINGDLDPWRSYSILTPPAPETKVILIPGAYHSQDLEPSQPGDSSELKNARLETFNYIKKFINLDTTTEKNKTHI